jgi:phosphonatase-like hydrolase
MDAIKLVIFDIAGTIIEDHSEVVSAFAGALDKHRIPYTDDELKEWKGSSKEEVIRHFVERQGGGAVLESAVGIVYADFRIALERHYRENGVVPIAGAADTFAWLRERGIRIATTSGFYREVSELILEATGWRGLLSAGISSSDVPAGRPAPYMIFRAMEAASVASVREVVNVGDTPLDLQAGTNAGVREVVGVLTGLHGKERLQQESHTALLPSVGDLPAWMEKQYPE